MSNEEYVNSQGEVIAIRRAPRGEFEGEPILCICDDPEVSRIIALHLLDEGTIDWLIEQLAALRGR